MVECGVRTPPILASISPTSAFAALKEGAGLTIIGRGFEATVEAVVDLVTGEVFAGNSSSKEDADEEELNESEESSSERKNDIIVVGTE